MKKPTKQIGENRKNGENFKKKLVKIFFFKLAKCKENLLKILTKLAVQNFEYFRQVDKNGQKNDGKSREENSEKIGQFFFGSDVLCCFCSFLEAEF